MGDWVPMFSKVNDTTAFKIAAIKPAEELVWVKPDSTWAWTLTDADGRTRLVTGCGFPYPGTVLPELCCRSCSSSRRLQNPHPCAWRSAHLPAS